METKEFKIYVEESEIFYLWVPEKNYFFFNPKEKNKVIVILLNQDGSQIKNNNYPFEIKKSEEIYIVFIKNKDKKDFFTFELNKNTYPFVLPGFGITPSHFEFFERPLYLYEEDINLWTYLPENMNKIIIQTTLPHDCILNIIFPNGKKRKLEWLSLSGMPYRSAIVENLEKNWYGFEGKATSIPFRFLVYGGYPLFFEKPPSPFKYMKQKIEIINKRKKSINGVLKFFFLNRPIFIHNSLSFRKSNIYLPPLKLSVKVDSGFNYKEIFIDLNKKNKEKIKLEEILSSPNGWVCGDLHLHSCINSDGADLPEIITESAICNGLDFIFISDNPNVVKRCEKYNKKNKFLILPGQEIGTYDVHINALNVRENLQRYSNLKNTVKTIETWIEKIEEYEKNGENVCLMLNHPSHLPEISKTAGYFRSWWVIDRFEKINIVENFDFDTWFKKLNEGKKIVGLWTTDSHDSSLIPPGFKRSYVYVGKNFNIKNLINGIKNGHIFASRYPGVVIDFKINNCIPGEEVFVKKNDILYARIICGSKRPIRYIEIIGDGTQIYIIDGEKSFFIDKEILLKPKYKWIIVRVYLFEEEWRKDGHSLEPIVFSKCAGFTNPIWIKNK